MTSFLSKFAFGFLLIFMNLAAVAQNTADERSYFTKDLLISILSQENCTGVRFYPIKDEVTKKNMVMLIGINDQGHELYDESSDISKYQVYRPQSKQNISAEHTKRDQAKTLVTNYFSSNSGFVSEFSKSELLKILANSPLKKRRDGIMVERSSGSDNFSVGGYKKQNSKDPVPVGDTTSGGPCPTDCDPADRYLISPPRNN